MVGEGGCNFFPSVCADVGTDNQICRRRAAWRHSCFSIEHILGILLPNICWKMQQEEKDYNLAGPPSTPGGVETGKGVDAGPSSGMTKWQRPRRQLIILALRRLAGALCRARCGGRWPGTSGAMT